MATTKPLGKSKAGVKRATTRWPFLRRDFSLIYRASIVFICCAMIGTLLVIGSQSLLENQLNALSVTQIRATTLQEKLKQAEIGKRQIDDYKAPYLQLVLDGFVGEEKRLRWVETVQGIQRKNLLPPISYDIAEQQIFQVDPTIDMGQFELRGSKITVNMDVFHEMDLINFLEGIKKKQYYDLKSCNLERLLDHDGSRVSPLLHVECTLYWITIDKNGLSGNDTAALSNT